jgi:hemoglobin
MYLYPRQRHRHERKSRVSMTDTTDRAARRAQMTADIMAQTGIDEALIARLVEQFYAKVREDAVLGPIFAARVEDWGRHLGRMRAFWSSVALMSGNYHGNPMEKHLPLPVGAEHFDRWLELFRETAAEVCRPEAARHFIERAERIAQSLEFGIAAAHGVMLGKGERFHAPPTAGNGSPSA